MKKRLLCSLYFYFYLLPVFIPGLIVYIGQEYSWWSKETNGIICAAILVWMIVYLFLIKGKIKKLFQEKRPWYEDSMCLIMFMLLVNFAPYPIVLLIEFIFPK